MNPIVKLLLAASLCLGAAAYAGPGDHYDHSRRDGGQYRSHGHTGHYNHQSRGRYNHESRHNHYSHGYRSEGYRSHHSRYHHSRYHSPVRIIVPRVWYGHYHQPRCR